VREKLRGLHQQVEGGLRPRRRYTVADALEDWLAYGVGGLSARTVTLYRGTIVKALDEELGAVRLTELTARDVQSALAAMASRLSTRTLQIDHNVLVRAIRQAERDDLVARNVAAPVDAPRGQSARPTSTSATSPTTGLSTWPQRGSGSVIAWHDVRTYSCLGPLVSTAAQRNLLAAWLLRSQR
jgi:hypothetical protein